MDHYASIGKRFLGGLIDYLLFYVAFFLYVYYFGEPYDEGTGYRVTGMRALMIPGMWFLYFPLMESISGQTLGKRVAKTRVVKVGGGEIGFGDSALRHIVDFIDILFLFGLIGFIMMKNSAQRQRLGDQLAKTIVVEDREAICMKCGESLVLSFRELERGRFVCPVCKQENVTARSLDKGIGNDILDA